jgi:parallel beta-helix repeat protein
MNNLLEDNHSTLHGIVHFSNSSAKAVLMNNTIVNNTCSGQGGAIFVDDGSAPLLMNNIIYGNTPASLQLTVSSKLDFVHCLIEGGQNGFTGAAFLGTFQDCFDSNPLFLSSNDFHLQDVSPCISAGADSVQVSRKLYFAPATDLEGNPRPNPSGSHPDIGAFENASGNPSTGMGENEKPSPSGFQLLQNYPNPFNPGTVITYELPAPGEVRLTVFDVQGREIEALDQGRKPAGLHRFAFDGTRLAAGVYFCKLQAGARVSVQKMVLLK